MKISKKILSLVLVMLLALSTVAFAITASAAQVDEGNPGGSGTTSSAPASATLKIHKYALADTAGNESSYIGNSGKDANPSFTAPSGATPLAGVTFTIYWQGDLNDPIPAQPETSGVSTASATTDADGVATFTVGDGSSPAMPVGLYYVVETSAPASVTTMSAPFFVYLPSTNAEGTAWLSVVNVYPKNLTTLANTTLTKTVNTAAYVAADVATAPTFALIDVSNSNAEVVTFTLASKDAAAPAPTVSSDAKYSTVTASVNGGVMSVFGLPVGTYKWTEKTAVTLEGSTTPLPKASDTAEFTVAKRGDNSNFNYTMDNSTTPTITKVADAETQSIGKDVVWTLTPSVPSDIASYQVYKITDTIPDELDFAGVDAVTVTVKKGSDSVEFTKGTDYAADYNTATRKLTIDFKDGLSKLVGATLTIKITTQINANAVVGEAIVNNAKLDFTNQYGVEGSDEDSASVKTGAALFTKVDAATNAGLAGAVFELQDAEGNKIAVSATDAAKGEFVVNPTANSYNVTSGANGKIYIKGLAYGDYKLVEVKAPAGYQLVTAPITFTVNADSATTALTIKNVPQPDLPLTGGMGTMLFTIIGLALIGGGAFFFFRSRKSKKEEN